LSFKNRFPYVSVIDGVSDFKFGMQLGFAKTQHQITHRIANFSRCVNIEGDPANFDVSLAQDHTHILSTANRRKFEVASFSPCKNITGDA